MKVRRTESKQPEPREAKELDVLLEDPQDLRKIPRDQTLLLGQRKDDRAHDVASVGGPSKYTWIQISKSGGTLRRR